MFETHPILLSKLLDEVDAGFMQLPEFQRGWIWDDSRVKELLISILRGFPIGAIMRLEAGGSFEFKTRKIEGVSEHPEVTPQTLLLDGQQRMTSLYQALTYQGAVDTWDERGRKMKRWYYVDIQKALDGGPTQEDSVISVPENRKQATNFGRDIIFDLSVKEYEYHRHMIPTESIFGSTDWMLNYFSYWHSQECEHPYGDVIEFWKRFESEVVNRFKAYQLPVISLDNTLPREGVCVVFEKVNTGGVVLTVFELLTATLAAEGFNLRDDWKRRSDHIKEQGQALQVLKGLTRDQFLQAVTLLVTQDRRRKVIAEGTTNRRLVPGVGCARRDILSLTRSEFEKWADVAEEGFKQAARFLTSLHIYRAYDLPYAAQLVSLAAIYAEMGDKLNPADARGKLERWYWSGVFNEDYAGTTETRMANDIQQVPEFIQSSGDKTLDMLEQAIFLPERLLTLTTRRSAAYKGLHALQMKYGAKDWRTGYEISLDSFFDNSIDIHHIFPQAWCKKQAENKLGVPIPSHIFNSAINKAPLSAHTNRIIGGDAPSRYISRLKRDNEKVDEAIRSSDIDPDALERDDFVSVFISRGMALMSKISDAMGKELSDGEQVFKAALRDSN